MTDPATEIAYAKINLALHVRQRRPDGYHELETLFAFAEEGDVLTAELAPEFSLRITGPFADGLSTAPDNLVLRAVTRMAEANGITQGLAFSLDKRLPIASGIGGGSADAGAALRLATQLWGREKLSVSPAQIAETIGADVPACLLSQSCFGTGIGEHLTPLEKAPWQGAPLLLVNPRLACPTGPIFKAWDGVDRGPLDRAHWQKARNDLQDPACSLLPVIGDVVALLQAQAGAVVARMSGSGATCFALFETTAHRDAARDAIHQSHPNWWTLASQLR